MLGRKGDSLEIREIDVEVGGVMPLGTAGCCGLYWMPLTLCDQSCEATCFVLSGLERRGYGETMQPLLIFY